MEPLITVIIVLAIATFATGLLLPLAAARRADGRTVSDEEQLAAELTARR